MFHQSKLNELKDSLRGKPKLTKTSLTAHIAYSAHALDLADWRSQAWQGEKAHAISNFRPESVDFSPRSELKLAWSDEGLWGIFQTRENDPLCTFMAYGDPVYLDSCVEIFVQPFNAPGYFNFEFNPGGAMFCGYVTDPTRTPDGIKGLAQIPWEDARHIRVEASGPGKADANGQTIWTLGFLIPFSFFEKYAKTSTPKPGDTWRGNFYKCSGRQNLHWASWSPLNARNFHLPECFGILRFEA